MGHRETYEHYYRGMSPGDSHEEAYMMQDRVPMDHFCMAPQGQTCQADATGYCNPAHQIVPGSKAEHDLVGCAQLYDERCWYCQPETLRERIARLKRNAARQLEIVVGIADHRITNAREDLMRRLDITLSSLSHRLAPTWDFSDGKQRQAGPFPWYRQIPADLFDRAQQVVARQRHHFDDGEIPF